MQCSTEAGNREEAAIPDHQDPEDDQDLEEEQALAEADKLARLLSPRKLACRGAALLAKGVQAHHLPENICISSHSDSIYCNGPSTQI